MMVLAEVQVAPVPGEGFLLRRPHVLLISLGAPESETAAKLINAVAAEEIDGLDLVRRVASVVVTAPRSSIAPFCLLADSEKGVISMVHGSIQVRVDEQLLFDGDASPTWTDGFLSPFNKPVTVLPPDMHPLAEVGQWDLREGLIPAGGAILSIDSGDVAAPDVLVDEMSTPSPKNSEPHAVIVQRETDFELIDLTRAGVLDGRESLPLTEEPDGSSGSEADPGSLVTGIKCGRQHFNHPEALYCAHCGLKMVHLTKLPVEGARPPLGIVVIDDGSTYALDVGYVIGREPASDRAVRDGAARPLSLNDESNSVSRIHAEIRLDGWNVQLLDRGSSNGTFVHHGDGTWARLNSDAAHLLNPGDEVSIGERRLVFESNVIPSARVRAT